MQVELVTLVALAAGLTHEEFAGFANTFVPAPVASLLTGYVIMADWLASDQTLFPLVSNGYDDEGEDGRGLRMQPSTWDDVSRQVAGAWQRAGLIPAWHEDAVPNVPIDDLYRNRFGFSESMRPRPMQRAAVEVARSVETPGLMIIEAPMGEGKTEAALAAAEILAARTGRGGICVALPTMATTDAMFGRVHRWLERLPHEDGADARSVFLAHGKARLNEEFQGLARSGGRWVMSAMGEDLREGGSSTRDKLRNPPDSVVVSQWMEGRKKGMLANFVVCTVDQVLMGALEMKHLCLRQLALANKVVVIDECHAYDSYMRCYLNRVLEWLGAMGVPVVLLSATLPAQQRREMLTSYQRGQCAVEAPVEKPVRRRPPRRRSGMTAPTEVSSGEEAQVSNGAAPSQESHYRGPGTSWQGEKKEDPHDLGLWRSSPGRSRGPATGACQLVLEAARAPSMAIVPGCVGRRMLPQARVGGCQCPLGPETRLNSYYPPTCAHPMERLSHACPHPARACIVLPRAAPQSERPREPREPDTAEDAGGQTDHLGQAYKRWLEKGRPFHKPPSFMNSLNPLFFSNFKVLFGRRVRSWLRTNAGGAPNTCKSRG